MTASSLDPKAALLVVDLQKAILGLPAVHPIDGIVNKAVAPRGMPMNSASMSRSRLTP